MTKSKAKLEPTPRHLHKASLELYGLVLTVIPRFFLRPEHKFASVDALREGIAADSARALELLTA